MDIHKLCMKISQEECSKTFTKMRHIALIFKKGKLLAWGINKTKTHPLLKKFPYKSYSDAVHAEILCNKKIKSKDKSKLDMIVVRINRTGNVGNSMPCAGCQAYLKSQGFKKVKYSDGEGGFCTIQL